MELNALPVDEYFFNVKCEIVITFPFNSTNLANTSIIEENMFDLLNDYQSKGEHQTELDQNLQIEEDTELKMRIFIATNNRETMNNLIKYLQDNLQNVIEESLDEFIISETNETVQIQITFTDLPTAADDDEQDELKWFDP